MARSYAELSDMAKRFSYRLAKSGTFQALWHASALLA